jgi:hypothetical protein
MRLREQVPSFYYRERYKQQRGNGVAQQAMVNAGGHPAIGLKRKFISMKALLILARLNH